MLRGWIFTISVLVGCGPALPPGGTQSPTGLQLPPPSRSIHLRASFDTDPSVYVGRFLPEGTKPEDVDENVATVTRCSKFIHPKVVATNQDLEETMYVSRNAAVSLGLPVLANVNASRTTSDNVRVRYSISKKIQSDIDADGLVACCKADPSQCTGTIIGEFVMGSGEVLQSKESNDQLDTKVVSPQGASAGVGYGAKDGAKKAQGFKDVYFAFLTSATPVRLSGASANNAGGTDCSWCDTLPGSLDGKYFCGISPEATSESRARDLAMRNAREQVVSFLGESIATSSKTRSSALKGMLEDEQIVTAAAEGIASQVKDEKWCKADRIATPEGEHYRARVLAFFPSSGTSAATKNVADAVIAKKKAAGTLTPEDERALHEAAGHAK